MRKCPYHPKMYKWLFASRISQAQFHEYVLKFHKLKTIYTNETIIFFTIDFRRHV